MKTPRTVLAVLVVCAALSACGGQGDGPASPGTTGAAPVTSSASPDPSVAPVTPSAPAAPSAPVTSADPMPTVPPKGGPSKPPGPGGTTLTGTVQAGVEPNCLLLDGNLLIGGPRDLLKPGAKVTVTGRPQPDMMTTCQQGAPFVVESARPA